MFKDWPCYVNVALCHSRLTAKKTISSHSPKDARAKPLAIQQFRFSFAKVAARMKFVSPAGFAPGPETGPVFYPVLEGVKCWRSKS